MSDLSERYTFANESYIPAGIATTIRGMIVNWDKVPSYNWAAYCTDDFDITLGGQRAQGLEAAKAMRGATFDPSNGPLTHCQHTLREVYLKAGGTAQGTANIVFTGTVKYTVVSGKEVQEDFATTFELLSVGHDQYKIQTARIYIDTALLGQGLADLQKS